MIVKLVLVQPALAYHVMMDIIYQDQIVLNVVQIA
jgi:hypothetical protein